ncbi:glycosyltransferase family 9 protein [Arcobacter sp. FWKO B]|uniref:glycosyltransferase family 9 protein n=1 Tax=Arcobacter sp. FWKO B TaxID=2593672 RepID=UPI0018A4F6F3|nr:glycosyltransferase family 9 protein [Arcobacter sp. FWKO B]QOG11451.1 glycosyltransferase family 9 protein [Arcobacter sp. FWKO B]
MKILITRHDKIGDFCVTLPLFKAIKEQYPTTSIIALVSKVNFNFAENIDFIDGVILYDKEDFFGTLKKIKEHKFDASISAFIDTRLGFLLFLSGIKTRIAPATKIAQIFFNKKIVQRRSKVEKTEWQYNMDLGKVLFPNLNLEFSKPLLSLALSTKQSAIKKIVFHPGFGGSSDGNLKLDDYLALGKVASKLPSVEVVFTFGPDDTISKEYISTHLDFEATILESKMSLIEFCQFLSGCELFVSTSTGPMHLAGAVNIKTLSFFGDNLFASSKRWSSINDTDKQHNFMINANYSEQTFDKIKNTLIEIVS